MVKRLLDNGADCNIADITLNTPLMVAAYESDIEVIKLLVNASPDLEAKRYTNKWTALSDAALNEWADAVKFLIDCGSDLDARDAGGEPHCSLRIRTLCVY
jgi:uncharacterized protein